MASYYVWSSAAGSANGSSWANAYTTLSTAFSGKAAGDVFYVAHDHAESAAGLTIIASGTAANPSKVVCVDRAGTVPPVSADRRTTATFTATTFNALTLNGSVHYDGCIFIAGTGSTSSTTLSMASVNNTYQRYDNCSLRLGIAAAGSSLVVGGSSSGGILIEFNNTTLSFAHIGHTISVFALLRWRNTPLALIGTAVPTLLFTPSTNRGGSVECFGVDLSAAGSGKTLVETSSNQAAHYSFVDCKINASVTKSTVPVGVGAPDVDFVRCGSSGVNYAIFSHRNTGTLDHETTIVRTGGASDGTTALSWKIATTPNSVFSSPFECPPIAIWNDAIGSAVTATVEGIWGGGAVPNDDEVWLDVEYLGDASSPQGSFVNDGKANLLAAAAAQTSSSETWGGSTTKFKLAVSFTAQQKGWIYARVKCAKASSTFYIDPLVTLT